MSATDTDSGSDCPDDAAALLQSVYATCSRVHSHKLVRILPESGDRFGTKSEFMLCLNAVKMSLISIA